MARRGGSDPAISLSNGVLQSGPEETVGAVEAGRSAIPKSVGPARITGNADVFGIEIPEA